MKRIYFIFGDVSSSHFYSSAIAHLVGCVNINVTHLLIEIYFNIMRVGN
jgi:hypothetical protein